MLKVNVILAKGHFSKTKQQVNVFGFSGSLVSIFVCFDPYVVKPL